MRNDNDFDDLHPLKRDPLIPINDFRRDKDILQKPLLEPLLPKVNFEKDHEEARRKQNYEEARRYDLGGGHEIITRG